SRKEVALPRAHPEELAAFATLRTHSIEKGNRIVSVWPSLRLGKTHVEASSLEQFERISLGGVFSVTSLFSPSRSFARAKPAAARLAAERVIAHAKNLHETSDPARTYGVAPQGPA